MRILLDVSAVPTRPVGAGVYTVELASNLSRQTNIDLHLLCRSNDAARWHALAPQAPVHAVVPPSRPARLLWERFRGARFAKQIGCELWHGPHYTLPRNLGCATIVTVHDLTFFDQPETHERIKVRFFRNAIRRNSTRATRVICVSRFTASRLDAIVPGHAPTEIVHHGVDHVRFQPRNITNTPSDIALLEQHEVRAPYIVFVGTIQPRKALPVLVEAFAAGIPTSPDLRLVIAGGDGWGTEQLNDAIRLHGVESLVLRVGYVDDATVAALYRRADVVAYPSLAEGFGLPVLEAMACGAPIVTTRGTAMDEFIGDAALAVEPGDVRALAAALQLARDSQTAERLARLGPRIAAEYSWAKCVDEHLGAYRRALEQSR